MSDVWVLCLLCDMRCLLVWDGDKLTIHPHHCEEKKPEDRSRWRTPVVKLMGVD